MKLLAYIRLSKETKYEKSMSLDTQQRTCEAYALRNNLTIYKNYVDDGYSGNLPYEKRPGILNAMNELKASDIFLVSQLDRVGRNPEESHKIWRLINERGARLISCNDEGTFSDSPLAQFQVGLAFLIGQNYRLDISVKTKAALANKKMKGEKLGGKHTPYGYKLAEDGVHLEINPEEQVIMRKLVELHAQGISYRKMPQVLAEMGITNRGIKWSKDTIHLKVEAYRRRNEMVHTQ